MNSLLNTFRITDAIPSPLCWWIDCRVFSIAWRIHSLFYIRLIRQFNYLFELHDLGQELTVVQGGLLSFKEVSCIFLVGWLLLFCSLSLLGGAKLALWDRLSVLLVFMVWLDHLYLLFNWHYMLYIICFFNKSIGVPLQCAKRVQVKRCRQQRV